MGYTHWLLSYPIVQYWVLMCGRIFPRGGPQLTKVMVMTVGVVLKSNIVQDNYVWHGHGCIMEFVCFLFSKFDSTDKQAGAELSQAEIC